MKKYLILSKTFQLLLLISFISVEINSLRSGLAYRYQYLLILYYIIPTLILWGLIDWYAYSKIKTTNNYIRIIPFIIVLILYIALSFEGKYSIERVSLIFIFALMFSAVLILVSLFGLRKKHDV